ncbi:MAG: DUF4445 domain-containing protein [Candidatus Thiodiazotropha sp. (ex Dulcina madagascariensis)]|nr:DUF4445 domain-containing protein [Candidatus Thiodiazotropha sp. (ex Dulcina madagascariensis)]
MVQKDLRHISVSGTFGRYLGITNAQSIGLLPEISPKQVELYAGDASREKIDKDIDFIMAFTSLLSQYKDCTGDEVLVDVYSLASRRPNRLPMR